MDQISGTDGILYENEQLLMALQYAHVPPTQYRKNIFQKKKKKKYTDRCLSPLPFATTPPFNEGRR